MSDSRLIEKMKKLLALSQSTSNEHEAMSAARKLHSMLAKYNVSISELDESPEEIGNEGEMTYNRPWKRVLAMYVAELYFCKFYIVVNLNQKSKATYMFVGTESNRMFALHIFNMIVKTVEKESRRESKLMYGKEVSSFVNSFWTGAMDRIVERCKELIEMSKSGDLEDEEGNKLPALLSTYEQAQLECQDWMDNNLNLKSVKNRTRADDVNGLRKGREAGNKVQLSRSLHKSSGPKLLGGN